MKTTEDLFRDYAASALSGVDSKLMNLKMFRSALTEHDNEIKSKIEVKIKEKKRLQEIELDQIDRYKDNQLISDLAGQIEALTELLIIFEEVKEHL